MLDKSQEKANIYLNERYAAKVVKGVQQIRREGTREQKGAVAMIVPRPVSFLSPLSDLPPSPAQDITAQIMMLARVTDQYLRNGILGVGPCAAHRLAPCTVRFCQNLLTLWTPSTNPQKNSRYFMGHGSRLGDGVRLSAVGLGLRCR